MTEEQKTLAISKLSSDFGYFCARTTGPDAIDKIKAEGKRVREAMYAIDPTLRDQDDENN